MAQLHMTEAELARDIGAMLDRVEAGTEIVIERDHKAVAVLRSPVARHRTISESIEIAKRREKERGYAVTPDPDFADDIQEIIRNRQQWNPPAWD